jgi:hypothetical protein
MYKQLPLWKITIFNGKTHYKSQFFAKDPHHHHPQLPDLPGWLQQGRL